MFSGKTLDVGLVDDGLVPVHVLPGSFGGPVEIRIDHDAFRHERRAVALVEGTVVAAFHVIAVYGRIPCQRTRMRACIGIEQQLVRIEAVAVGGIVRPVNAIAVEGAGADARDVAVKHLVGVFGQFDAGLALAVEQADLDLGGIGREQRKIGTLTAPVCAERIGKAFFDRTGHDCPRFLRGEAREDTTSQTGKMLRRILAVFQDGFIGTSVIPARVSRARCSASSALLRRTGTIPNASARYGPGSSERHEGCRTASGTR